MAGADLKGGFHDPARAPALGGISLLAPELIQGKINSQLCFVLGQISPTSVMAVCSAQSRGRGWFQGRQVLPWQN